MEGDNIIDPELVEDFLKRRRVGQAEAPHHVQQASMGMPTTTAFSTSNDPSQQAQLQPTRARSVRTGVDAAAIVAQQTSLVTTTRATMRLTTRAKVKPAIKQAVRRCQRRLQLTKLQRSQSRQRELANGK